MKTLQITNTDNSIVVNYLTDLIGDNNNFTIFQIKQVVAGVEQIGLTDAVITEGFFKTIGKSHTVVQFTDFVKRKAYNLYSYENLSTGAVKTTIWAGGYGDAGAIGEDQL
jgi:hypothetical protein